VPKGRGCGGKKVGYPYNLSGLRRDCSEVKGASYSPKVSLTWLVSQNCGKALIEGRAVVLVKRTSVKEAFLNARSP
jgi:hypothetical protein